MALTYNTFTTQLANFLTVPLTDAAFVAAIPQIIDDAEQRIYRDLDLLQTVTEDHTGVLIAGVRSFTYPTPAGGGSIFFVVDQVNVITPAGTSDPDTGTRNALLPASKEMLDYMFPSATGSGVPQYFAPFKQTSCLLGPFPDAAYTVEVIGTVRPAPLSNTNQTTFISTYLSDLFFKAAMVEGCGYQQNFSAIGDNPQSATSWEAQYKTALTSAQIEEIRKKHGSEGWSSKQPDPIATPPRT